MDPLSERWIAPPRDSRFCHDLSGEAPFPICKYCLRENCVADDFNESYVNLEWRGYEEEDVVFGDGSKPPLDNNLIRKHLYRQFLAKTDWSQLQRNVRVELPSCATKLIRHLYPAEGNAYVGHRWRATTKEKKTAVDANSDKLEEVFWAFENNAWVLMRGDDDEN